MSVHVKWDTASLKARVHRSMVAFAKIDYYKSRLLPCVRQDLARGTSGAL